MEVEAAAVAAEAEAEAAGLVVPKIMGTEDAATAGKPLCSFALALFPLNFTAIPLLSSSVCYVVRSLGNLLPERLA